MSGRLPNASRIKLRELRPTDEVAFRRAVAEFASSDPEWTFAFAFDPEVDFREYCERVRLRRQGIGLAEGWVPETFLVAVAGESVVGRVSIRHRLNDFLERYGGHIGYGVVASERRKGYATAMLREALIVARDLDLERVLLTCDDDNVASIRTIEKNGGQLQDSLPQEGTSVPKRRYWIEL